MEIVIGIDLGTQGARALAVDLHGNVLAHAERRLAAQAPTELPAGWFEQAPLDWRETVVATLHDLAANLGEHLHEVRALAACGTSGTLCLVDAEGTPLRPAIMYSDMRATAQVGPAAEAWRTLAASVGYTVTSSFALPRLLWVQAHEPHILARARWALSPADLVAGWLSGVWGVSDWTNMLKTGYDTFRQCWPDALFSQVGISTDLLPRVQPPGTVIGLLRRTVAHELGLPLDTLVVSGATDGIASQFASGASAPGQWNTTIGTTLVLKGVSRQIVADPLGRVYCHRHPDGFWLPGGASSTGAECLNERFGAAVLSALDATALAVSPTALTVYPLCRRGERFPFVRPEAEGFERGTARSDAERYAAYLEGIACVERLAYDTVSSLGAEVGETVYTAGGGTRGEALTQIRADTSGRTMRVAAVPEAAMGAAIMAASAITGDAVSVIAGEMVHLASETTPRPALRDAYDDVYGRFLSACKEQGYLS